MCIRYIDVNIPRSARREKLLSEYRFHCQCKRCENEKDISKQEKIQYTTHGNNNKKKKATKVVKQAKTSNAPVSNIYAHEQLFLNNLQQLSINKQ